MSNRQHERLAVATPEERETRLQQMSNCQHKKLAAEAPETIKETRSQCYSVRYREQSVQPQLPLFHQCSVKAKVQKVMQTCLHWIHQYAVHAQQDSMASSVTQTQLSVCVVAVTSIF